METSDRKGREEGKSGSRSVIRETKESRERVSGSHGWRMSRALIEEYGEDIIQTSIATGISIRQNQSSLEGINSHSTQIVWSRSTYVWRWH